MTGKRHVSRSQNRAVFTGKHKPHGTGILRVDKHPDAQCEPHAVATATHNFLTDGVPEQEDRKDVALRLLLRHAGRIRRAHLRQLAKALRALRWRTWVG